jgi:hypothetical protein
MQADTANRHDAQAFGTGGCHRAQSDTHVGRSGDKTLDTLMGYLLLVSQLHAHFGFIHIQHESDKYWSFGNPRLAARDTGNLCSLQWITRDDR